MQKLQSTCSRSSARMASTSSSRAAAGALAKGHPVIYGESRFIPAFPTTCMCSVSLSLQAIQSAHLHYTAMLLQVPGSRILAEQLPSPPELPTGDRVHVLGHEYHGLYKCVLCHLSDLTFSHSDIFAALRVAASPTLSRRRSSCGHHPR
jgi:hypothetical protein